MTNTSILWMISYISVGFAWAFAIIDIASIISKQATIEKTILVSPKSAWWKTGLTTSAALASVSMMLATALNIASQINTNSFKINVLKIQQNLTPDQLNDFVYGRREKDNK